MSAEETIQEQRTSFRCTVPESRQFCELRIGSTLLPAILMNESAGGFSVVVDRPPGLDVGQTAELHTDTGWFAVCAVHVAPVVPTEDDDAATDEEPDQRFRLGLSRLSETEAPPPPRVSFFAGNLLRKLWPSGRGGGGGRAIDGRPARVYVSGWRRLGARSVIILGALVAIIAVAAPFAPVEVTWDAGPSTGELPSWGDRLTGLIAPNEPQSDPAWPDLRWPRAKTSPTPSGQGNVVARTEQEARELMRRLPGPATLAMPEVVRDLQLTGAQQERIRHLIEAAYQAVHDLDARSQGKQRQEIAHARTVVLEEARRQAMEVLTDEQRARWEQLVGKK